jgi:hypothetical protein
VRDTYLHAVAHATQGVFGWAVLFGLAAFRLAGTIKAVPLRGRDHPQPPVATQEPELVSTT